ncbi:ELF3-like protein 2 isoform X1 [Dioscorea cayenensis subsp. rotundata]|uniref:ELF3-like protein 2 isoform X1 n=1 Tax=Dioscorea cayennensis subsp. rotundata TaxID=55577 RepID=A0AB40B332_DIOCR|nr:ELF3-like protein 2 isoform X1 [Dioscorea cayenensis subsp. rotundata]XP_039121733.1 ELF3-like protein 2 isoform X1 [Dioscorea cayenensis subsp. rotundata]
MKGGKEEEKIVGPLFPRLHVNDADKGGPRAPPRNKMALYEQLSIPSQRFSSAPVPAPSRPLPPQNGGLQVPSTSLSQGYGHERNGFPSFYMPPHTPAHSAERVHSRSSGGINNNASRLQSESRSARPANERFLAATGSPAECSSLHQRQCPYGKKSSGNAIDDDDDFRVPTFVQPGNATCSNKDTPVLETEKGISICSKAQQKSFSTSNSSVQISKSYGKAMEQSKLSSINEKEKNEDLVINEPNQRAVGHIVARESLVGLSHSPKASSDHSKAVNVFESSCHETAVQGQETCGGSASAGSKCLNEEVLRAKNESCLRALVDANSQFLKVGEKQNPEINAKPSGSPAMGDAEGNDDTSDSSMVDSISGMEISPDDVVGIIGPKHFWKARRAIINQQRVFAIQVFELHRLIKVQKLIAASPHMLLEESSFLKKSSQKVVPAKILQHEPVPKPLLAATQPKDLQKSNQRIECSTEKTVDARPLPSTEDGSHGGHTVQNPRTGPYVGNPMPIPMSLDHQKPNPWCYHPPANQWLVPVMSPSEGLCYKPYTGPCPPPGGFIPPVYGGCCPMSLPPGDFMNPAYGIPASHQQQNMGVLSGNHHMAPNYFPAPYPVHVMNPMMSPSAVEQVSPLVGSRPPGQTEQSSCNISNLRSETISGRLWKAHGQVSKESGVQGSTASSPCEKTQADGRDALPLFPTAPQSEISARQPSASCGKANQTRVIKVVPHNARSATESAARIFRSIQEGRQQHDS